MRLREETLPHGRAFSGADGTQEAHIGLLAALLHAHSPRDTCSTVSGFPSPLICLNAPRWLGQRLAALWPNTPLAGSGGRCRLNKRMNE